MGNNATTVIWRAILIMVACWYIGLIFGNMSQRAVDENIARYKEANPIPLEDHERETELENEELENGQMHEAGLPGAGEPGEPGATVLPGATTINT